ncbi:MAG TPA: tetratricopeptide repeat protein [Candidatus Margulisiibacteriota bacterium]|nr:tetratricopeptide repeat protein [Candidatus Margulisiibacteriota bacterium]
MPDKKRLESAFTVLDKFLGILLVAAVFCTIFLLSHKALFDLDIWLHLASGKFILQNRSVPAYDIFSFTVAGKPWIDHSWLFQVISYLVYAHWQVGGLILLQSLVITSVFLILFLTGHKSIGSYFETAVFLFLTAHASTDRFNIRPDIFSLLFFNIYLYLLRFHPEKKTIWLLLPVQLLWVNMHGYFILGPLLVFFFIAAEFLRRRVEFLPPRLREGGALSNQAYGRLKAVLLLTVLAGLANPQGFKGALYPLHVFREVLTGSNKIFFQYIQELQPTFKVYYSPMHYYNIMLILCLVVVLVNFKRVRIVDIILAVFFFFFGLTIRNSAYFAFVAYLMAVTYAGETVKRFSSRVEIHAPGKNILFYLSKIIAQIIFIAFLVSRLDALLLRNYFDFNKMETQSAILNVDKDSYPAQAVQFILENKIGPNIFNDFNSGAYLVGNAWPRVKVFIDGRTELYGGEFFSQQQRILDGDISLFSRVVDKYNLDAVIFSMAFASPPPAMVAPLSRRPGWKLVFLDPYAAIFLKDIPKNREVIKRYAIDPAHYPVAPVKIEDLGTRLIYPSPYIKLARFFDLLKADEAVLDECREALRIMPNCAEAYQLRGKVFLRKKSYPEALDSLRAASALMPSNPEMLVDLGRCLKEMKDYKLAAEMFGKALRINKKYAPAHYYLGRINLELKNDDGAIEELGEAVNYDSKIPFYHLWLGRAYLSKAKKTKITSYLKKARQELEKAAGYNIEKDESLNREIEETKISLAF